MWAQIAGLAVNALGQDQQNRQQKDLEQEQMKRQNVLENRAMATSQLQGMQGSKQDAYMRQQAVLDNIMKKYKIGGM